MLSRRSRGQAMISSFAFCGFLLFVFLSYMYVGASKQRFTRVPSRASRDWSSIFMYEINRSRSVHTINLLIYIIHAALHVIRFTFLPLGLRS